MNKNNYQTAVCKRVREAFGGTTYSSLPLCNCLNYGECPASKPLVRQISAPTYTSCRAKLLSGGNDIRALHPLCKCAGYTIAECTHIA